MLWNEARVLAASLLLLLPGSARAAQETGEFELTPELLETLAAEVVPAIKAALGVEFEGGLQVRLATPDEIEAALFEENRALMRVQVDDEGMADKMARDFARALAEALLAKYRLGKYEVLVSSDAFPRLAELLDLPELTSADAVRAVLVHELGHAASDELYGATGVLYGLDSADRIQAYNSVLEGYAQHVARRICAAHGWSAGFETYERAIGRPLRPEAAADEGAAAEFFARVQVEVFASLYRDGERFIAALEQAGGSDAVARAFREPPSDSALIFEPGWFLDPASRPTLAYDFERPLDDFERAHPEPGWKGPRVSLTQAQLRVAFSLLPAEEIEGVTRALRNARVLTLTPPSAPGSKLIVLALYELASPADARHFFRLERRLLEAKDEAMKEGALRIVASSYEEFTEAGIDGFLADKRVKVGSQELPVFSGYGVRRRACVEILYTNVEVPLEEVAAELVRALTTALGDAERGTEDPSREAGD